MNRESRKRVWELIGGMEEIAHQTESEDLKATAEIAAEAVSGYDHITRWLDDDGVTDEAEKVINDLHSADRDWETGEG